MKAIVNVPMLAGLILMAACAAVAGTIYWTPAHEWAPQGHAGAIAAGDMDADGDVDLTFFCGEPMMQCWNEGTPTEPAWQFGPSPYQGVPFCTHQNGGFGDLDADGDLDLVIICWYDDFVRFYWNVGTPQDPVWQADLSVFDGVPKSLSTGQPRLADMDDDGDLDLMLGSYSGRIRFARNNGTLTTPDFDYEGWVDGVTIAGPCPTMGLGDVDQDGDIDLVRVTHYAWPQCFENVGTPEVFEFVENPDMLIGIELRIEGAFGMDLLDIDADGDPDMILAVGSGGGNLLFLNGGATPVERTSWGVIKAMYR
ncbi:VCBS repeat-containing protein [bacterium]|nr:VCBS repeat-containing protein [bacterium]